MKNPRLLLIEQAQTDDADEGTAWRERMEAWLSVNENHAPFNSIRLSPEFYEVAQARLNRAMALPLTLPRFFI
jgi:hypothetical protein